MIIDEVQTSDGVALTRIPVALVRDGLRDGWLTYSDRVRTPSGELVALDDAAGKGLWPSARDAAHRRFRDWQVRFAYTFTISVVILLIWRAAPFIPTAFEFQRERPWTSTPPMITACYALTLLATRLLWGSPLAAFGAVIMGLNLTRTLTGVGLFGLISELDPVLLTLTIVISVATGYAVAVPLGMRKERSWLAAKRLPVPPYVVEKYQFTDSVAAANP